MPANDSIPLLLIEEAIAAPHLSITHEETPVVSVPDVPEWQKGMIGQERTVSIGDNSGVLAIVTGIFLLMMLGFKHCRRLFSSMVQDLLGMRRRANVFDPHTSNENRTLALMALQWCVYTGLLLYSGILVASSHDICHIGSNLDIAQMTDHALSDTAKLIGLMAAYYVFQLCAYSIIGFVFTDATGLRLYIKGFTASQSLLGFALIVPALVAIFYPIADEVAVIIGILLYFIARLIFIIKGFRIFYTNFGSLLYFILYLCTLEIIPLFLVCRMALFLVDSL